MTGVDIATLTVTLLAGLGSGAIGSHMGARNQRRLYERGVTDKRNEALWSYEQALREEGRCLELEGMTAEDVRRKNGPTVQEARLACYHFLPSLPSELREDLTDPYPDVQTSTEAGDHMRWLANRLRDYLLGESEGRTRPLASRARRRHHSAPSP